MTCVFHWPQQNDAAARTLIWCYGEEWDQGHMREWVG